MMASSKSTILGDSIVKYVRLRAALTQAVRGAKIVDLELAIIEGIVTIDKFKVILLHVGTNDLYHSSVDQILEDFDKLISTIKIINPNSKLVISSLIPRPVDHNQTIHKIVQINNRLEILCIQFGHEFIPTCRRFSKANQPKHHLYAKTIYT